MIYWIIGIALYIIIGCFFAMRDSKYHKIFSISRTEIISLYLIDIFLNQEYDAFPVPMHDDMLDCMARILDEDLGAIFPAIIPESDAYSYHDEPKGSAWAS